MSEQMDAATLTDQSDPHVLKALKKLVQENEPEWKLGHSAYSDATRILCEWQSGDENVTIGMSIEPSLEEAENQFRLFGSTYIYFGQSQALNFLESGMPKPLRPDAKLPDVGDENNVWTRYNEAGRSAIKLRRGKAIMQVDASSFQTAKSFAQHISESNFGT
ncbi:MAG: hypothetical protein MSG64_05395 [Pyrinomonadaceae bacterium MAG19_C2-C3]|nr:hypothetical protein [Pyrinomonadaceae bacterium MAG19_C2-C3]